MNDFKKISDWDVLTPTGWQPFNGIKRVSKESYIKIIFNDDSNIECSTSHKIKLINNTFIYAKNIKIGQNFVGKDGKNKTVKSKRKISKKIKLYDLIDVSGGNEFYSNDIVSHNCAHIPDAHEVWVAANATTSTGGKSIILSTPNGVGDFFHKMWTDAESGENGFVTVKLPWDLHPERDLAWREQAGKEQGDKRKAAQEFDCNFSTSGNTVLQPETLTAYHKILKEPIEKRWAEQSLWLWEYPDYTKPYLVCADVARGDGKDKSAFHIIRLDTCEQVGEYRGVIDTKSYGNLLVGIANEYNKSILVVENNNIGWATLQQIIDLEYPNTFYSSADLTYVDVEKQLVGKINRMERNMTPGFTTTQKTRPLIISKLESYFQDNSFKLNSIRTWEELSTFIWNPSGKAEAMRGYNDDLVTSLGIGLWVRDTALRLQTECNELTKASLGSISRMSTEGVYTSRQDTAKKTWEMPLFSGGNKINKSLTSDSNDDNMEDLTKWL